MGDFRALALIGIATTGCVSSSSSSSDPCKGAKPGTVCDLAGNGQTAFIADGMPAHDTALYLPSEARRGPDGLVYIMDFNNMRIRRIEADGTVSTIAGDGTHAYAIPGSAAADSPLESPIDFDFLPDGRLIFVSYHDPRVLLIDTDGTLKTVAGDVEPGLLGNEGDGGPATSAKFIELTGITVASDGTIFVSDDQASRVRMIRNGTITTYAGRGAPDYSGDGGLATSAGLDSPSALALDDAGDLFIADSFNSAIRKVTPDGIITTVAGTGTSGFSGDGGAATAAQLSHPDGVAFANGSLIIGDKFNSRVRMVAADGTISTIAGTGTRGFSGNGGPALLADFGYLARVQLDTDGNVLIADQSNSCVRKVIAPL